MPDQSETLVSIPADGVELPGELLIPEDAAGLVAFAHGSGSSRHSPRNTFVADVLRRHGVGTLLFDLLTEEEDREYETRFDIDLLTARLVAATEWIREYEETRDLNLGYFGSSTGAAAALRAAARRGDDVAAVVSRGGRVDLASEQLPAVTAPTLFIVGGADTQVLELNRDALAELTCERELEVVEGAGHLFEGSGELDEVAELAAEWFESHLG
ncbi:alpha/beta hydrolase [Halobellus sp. Atlit-38R]|uniref:dienelactone hydrolase family protein n=1 Tax=Halobellus sp. Atlit-38R TaxID=2282131 RepID=UPI000EF20CAD|nr:dienelactone hydrolase family protein [Halobellus sp. Atlit-38R]RLM89396.1 alpha/beta hydrolase [Halobellus sp. Atlit-38R]